MEPTTQPILCCVGESVAGNPTQFVMERMFTAAELDWRVVTVDVKQADFSDAIAGIRAMKFSAIRFLPPYPVRAAAEFLPNNPVAKFIGAINSAMLTEKGWIGWHSLGNGICAEAAKKHDWSTMAVILVGDSIRTRSLLAAVIDVPPQCILWVNGRVILTDLLSDKNIEEREGEDLIVQIGNQEIATLVERLPEDVGSLLIVGDDVETVAEVEELCSARSLPTILATGDDTPELSSPFNSSRFQLSTADQSVAAKAFDFEQWSGQSADLGQLRDAYDEYCDF